MASMFPVDLRLKGRRVLLVGAGRVGSRKMEKILSAGASLIVVEKFLDEKAESLWRSGRIMWRPNFSAELLEGVSLVLAASSDPALNRMVGEAARSRGLWLNVADDPASSDFFMPALIERGDFRLTVSTGGESPALTARVAARLRAEFGPEYGRLTRLLGRLRPLVLAAGLTAAEREHVFRRLAGSAALLAALAAEDEEEIQKQTKALLAPTETGNEPEPGLWRD
ncbi:MAG: bifunctional precorrin-2 dehydrogenase/sirohydrochlorin ferrochelatase [Candidatus Adiutrix sp.]|jgi:siroheme synthase-like protein|nr:bifunctional precorrin-2 dehydrogenase/sirohydrochlorin ferrochelatase [Candidatus Adiutrix sp.]